MLVDTHCHLDRLPDPQAALNRAAEAGVTSVVSVSENPSSMAANLRLRHCHGSAVIVGLGLHPVWVTQSRAEEVAPALQQLADQLPSADLLGEVGLDFKWADSAEEQQWQVDVLDRQLDLASEHRKPVNLHSRRCLRQVMERAVRFRQETGLDAQLHWFTHSKKLLHTCNAEGIFVSVGPIILVDEHAGEVAAEIADDLLLLESDAPVPIGGQSGHPARVRQVAKRLAALKACSWVEIAERSSANHARYLRPI